jgi:hypothetical protein
MVLGLVTSPLHAHCGRRQVSTFAYRQAGAQGDEGRADAARRQRYWLCDSERTSCCWPPPLGTCSTSAASSRRTRPAASCPLHASTGGQQREPNRSRSPLAACCNASARHRGQHTGARRTRQLLEHRLADILNNLLAHLALLRLAHLDCDGGVTTGARGTGAREQSEGGRGCMRAPAQQRGRGAGRGCGRGAQARVHIEANAKKNMKVHSSHDRPIITGAG